MMKLSGMVGAASALLFATSLAHAAPGVVTGDLNVRAGEGTNHRVLAVIPKGTPVEVEGCQDGWCFVHEYQGYASARYISSARDAFASYQPGNRLRYSQPERFYGPSAADYAFGRNYGRSYYVPGNRLDYRESRRFFGPPDRYYRGGRDITADAGDFFLGNRLEYRRPYRFYGPEPRGTRR